MCTLNHSGEINCIHTSRSWENYIKNDYLHLFSNFSMNQPISYEYARFWASELNISIVNNHLHGWTTFPWRFSRLDLRRFGDLYQRMKTVFKISGMGLGADLSKFQAIYMVNPYLPRAEISSWINILYPKTLMFMGCSDFKRMNMASIFKAYAILCSDCIEWTINYGCASLRLWNSNSTNIRFILFSGYFSLCVAEMMKRCFISIHFSRL